MSLSRTLVMTRNTKTLKNIFSLIMEDHCGALEQRLIVIAIVVGLFPIWGTNYLQTLR